MRLRRWRRLPRSAERRKIANDRGIAFFVEIHRNNFTENLPQIKQLIELVPEYVSPRSLPSVVCGDLFLAGKRRERWRGCGAFWTGPPISGRISNGEAVQVG